MSNSECDRDHMEAILRTAEPPLYSYVCRLVRNRAEADDIYLESVARVQHMAIRGRLRENAQDSRALLFTIAHQLATDQHRLRRWTVEREDDEEVRPERPIAELLARQQLDMALDELPEGQRHALLLRVYGELGYTDIAHALNASEDLVKTWVCGARIRLANLLDADGQYIGSHAEEKTEQSIEQLSAYLDGELLPSEAAGAEAQLAVSEEWQEAREQLERADGLVRRCTEVAPSLPEPLGRLASPRVGTGPALRTPLLVAVALLVVLGIAIPVLWTGTTEAPVVPTKPVSGQEPTVAERPEIPAEPQRPDEAVEPPGAPQPDVPSAPPEAEPTDALALALAGTVLGQSPAAVIRDVKTGEQKVYRVGEDVRDGVTLVEVFEKEALLDADGESIRLTLGALTVEAPPERSIGGLWRVVLAIDGQEENFDDLLTFAQDGERVGVTDEHGGPFATGTLVERELMLQFEEGGAVYVLRGRLDWTLDSVVMRFQGPTPYGDTVDPESLELRFTRIPDDEQTVLGTLDERERAVHAIRDALVAYARDHELLFPVTLDMLVPEHLSSPEVFATAGDRRVTYDGQRRLAVLEIASAPRFDSYQTHAALGERLKAYDEMLRKQYGGDAWLNPATILTVEYTNPGVTYTVNARGDLHERLHGAGRQVNAAVPERSEVNSWITQDQSNLQQLRIVIQMFQNEHEGYSPGGWVSAYPEYLSDPSLLTSPKDDPGTDSYLYLYPGTQLHELVAERAGDPLVWTNDRQAAETIASEIPIVLNRTDYPGPEPGRNVLYLDWHVAYVPRDSDEWRTYIEPHLRRGR